MSSKNNAINMGSLTNGQILIGSTGANPVAATLTAGTGITITNGAGSITIGSSATNLGGLINIQYLTGSGTYTPTTGTQSIFVVAQAAGGGGGGSSDITAGSGYISGGVGGSGGACGFKYFPAVSAVSGTSYVVGTGGSGGGANNSSAPQAGGATTFGNSAMNLNGGNPGLNTFTNGTYVNIGGGGLANLYAVAGATAVSGDTSNYVVNGGPSPFNAIYPYYIFSTSAGHCGSGRAFLGAGVITVPTATSQFSVSGTAGSGHGSGGSGALAQMNTSNISGSAGGKGADGLIIVYEYGVA